MVDTTCYDDIKNLNMWDIIKPMSKEARAVLDSWLSATFGRFIPEMTDKEVVSYTDVSRMLHGEVPVEG